MTIQQDLTVDENAYALGVARALAAAGIPVFVAKPDPTKPVGFQLPGGWQQTQPDPRVVDLWQPGDALGAVMGHGLDLLDVDPRGGGDLAALDGAVPATYGIATTPSGGMHAFIRSMGVRSHDNIAPGIDVKAGDPEGTGRGFAFIAPTVRKSKVSGEPVPYRWLRAPDLELLATNAATDLTGAQLAEIVRAAHSTNSSSSQPNADEFLRVGPWADVAGTLGGGRNDGVHKLAAALRGRGGWRFEDALAYMDAMVWPLIDQQQGGHEFTRDEYEQCITGVWERYEDGAAVRVAEANDDPAERRPLNGLALLEAWFVEHWAGPRLAGRYSWARGLGWLSWDGRRWVSVDESVAVDDLRQYVIWLHASATAAGVEGDLCKKIAALGSRARLAAIVSLCRGLDGVRADGADFDRQPDLLNAANGVVDLRTGELLPHDPALRMTKLAPVEYRVGAEHADWKAALDSVPESVLDWYQLRLGQAITGHMTPDDVLVVQQGSGENGKTTLMAGIRAVLGDYYLLVSHRALLANSDAHPTELMDFRGARLALLEETPEERRLSVVRLKILVGTPEITARRIRKDAVTFAATHTLFLSTNYLPTVQETDHGTWRRLAALRFPYRWLKPGQTPAAATDRVGDPDLRHRIGEGSSGQHEAILAWLVDGARRWYADGRRMPLSPQQVDDDTREWRRSADLILGYLDDRIDFDPARSVLATELLDDINEWLVTAGHRAWSRELFKTRLAGHSEIAGHNVEHRKARPGDGLSRRPVRPGMVTTGDSPGPVAQWFGLKFREYDHGPEPTPGPVDNPVPTPENTTLVYTSDHDQHRESTLNQDHVPSVPTHTYTNENDDSSIYRVYGGVGTLGTLRVPLPDPGAVTDSSGSDPQTGSTAKPAGETSRAYAARQSAARDEKRAAALAAAEGNRCPLPAIADRSGTVASTTLALARAVLGAVVKRGELTVDVETTGYPLGHRHYALRTIQLGDDTAAVVLDATDPEHRALAAETLAAAPILHAHSATADLIPLAEAGVLELDAGWDRMHDTVIPAKLADPGSTGSDAEGLKELARDMLGDEACSPAADTARAALFKAGKWLTNTKATTPVERSGWANADHHTETMVRYGASDVLDDAALAKRLPVVEPVVLHRERVAQRMTARITHLGLPIDGDWTRQLLDEHKAARAAAAEQIRAHGVEPGKDKQLADRLTSLGVTLPATAGGRPSVAAPVLTDLRVDAELTRQLIRAVCDYREHDKAIGTYLEPYLQMVDNGDGRVRPTIYTLAADTGRMSSVRPNLQNVPRVGRFRGCITADPGYALISADFAGVELRTGAALSGDTELLRIITDEDAGIGDGLHWIIARQAFGPEASKGDRYNVKRGVFGRIYGSGIPGIARTLGIPEAHAAAIVDTLDATTPQLSAWSGSIREAVKGGRTQFPTYAGRVIHLPQAYPHKGPNYCIQGTARELLIDALLKWRDTRWGDSIILPVHDEIVAMVPEGEAAEATAALVECMETTLYGVRIKAEASKPAQRWADAS